ncbi:MAG TPA: DUF4864 domain-containing protein [Candidatus Sulfotelmatobacter sp.]|nr:DUF4864 domain-containing protein [Candidatus Sulfotelmatobacter sp.]
MRALRRWLFALIVLPVLGAAAAWAQAPATDVGAADRAAIRRVIGDQMAAFRRDDATAAFGFATQEIRDQFGSPERFLAMVREGYQAVYRPSDVHFGALVRIDGRLTQLVDVVGPDGVPHTAMYFMEHQPDGSWLIGGCMLAVGQGATT